MKHIVTLLLFALVAIASHAEIYKGTDAEGNTIYSDEELPNGTEIPTPSPNTVIMPKPKKVVKDDTEKPASYTLFKILSPGNDETLRISSGNIEVSLSVIPELDIKQGHSISVYIDGETAISKTTEMKLQIPNVSRGSHNLQAEIKDETNEVIIQSNDVTFHMKRASNQHEKPTGTPSGPRKPDGTPYKPGPSKPDGTPYTPGPQGVRFKPGPVIP
jgi:hypothetical protein